ncbi:response regulator [Limnoglobus roseus]|uniref:Response regulator n=1 Tax=Limnoglobus roseus TaxID=2598579 RepID=A0A5C1A972_9BACT|nr:response regulator [Limnoglobus roseus]QEL14753.1 response regulator [Limnoglobus roseus]
MVTKRLKVLCVDDNHDIADSEAMLLDVYGIDARACYDGPHAILAGREFHPDAYLVDLNMPGMDGCEVARELRAEHDGPPPLLVAITAKSAAEDYRRTQAAGFDAHLVKPVEPNRLLKMLAELRRNPT